MVAIVSAEHQLEVDRPAVLTPGARVWCPIVTRQSAVGVLEALRVLKGRCSRAGKAIHDWRRARVVRVCGGRRAVVCVVDLEAEARGDADQALVDVAGSAWRG